MGQVQLCKKQPLDRCAHCPACCHIRDTYAFEVNSESRFREIVFNTSYVLYLYPFQRYTISLSREEKERLESLAIKQSLNIKILPKKILYHESADTFYIMDYFVDHDICPFLKEKLCSIYPDRPQICKDYPFKIESSDAFQNIKSFIKIKNIEKPTLSRVEATTLFLTRYPIYA